MTARLLEEATALSFPRYPGTEGDARAIELVRARLAETGLETAIERFRYDVRPAWRTLRLLLVALAAAVALAGGLAPWRPGAAALVLAAAVAPAAALLGWAPWMERVYRREGPTETANVVGRRRAAGRRGTLVVLAHHDSKSQNLAFPGRMGATLAALGGTAWLALELLGAVAGRLPGPGAAAAGAVAALALLALSTLRSGNLSPGAVDNAGSVAILLALARRLPARVGPEVELIFLSTGAEEDHMAGAMRWLARHREELAAFPALALNLDGAGAPGRVVAIERFGWGRPAAPRLAACARRAAAGLDLPLSGIVMPPAVGIDAIPFVHAGIECLTLASGSLGPSTWAVHSAADRPELLDAATLETVAALAEETALLAVGELGAEGSGVE